METIYVKFRGREDIGIVVDRVGDYVEASFAYYKIISHVDDFEIVLVEGEL